jgi:glucose-1-phosphate adenylyltransferase
MWAYKFQGYWRDVGTIQAFWESNMDLINRIPEFNLYDPDWRIYTPNPVQPAHYIGSNGSVKKSLIAEGCMIYGSVRNSVIFPGVYIDEGAVVEDSIIMSNSRVGRDCRISHSIISEKVDVGSDVKMGMGECIPNESKPGIYNSGITVVGEGARIPAGTEIGKNVAIDMDACAEDFCSQVIDSGKSVFKGGVCE